MRAIQSNNCSIGDIISNLITKNKPPLILRQRSFSIRQRKCNTNDDFSNIGQYTACVTRKRREVCSPNVAVFEKNFQNWHAFTPQNSSRLFGGGNELTPIIIGDKNKVLKYQNCENPEGQPIKSEKFHAYLPRKRQSSKLEGYEDTLDSKNPLKVLQKFKPFILKRKQSLQPSKTSSQFYSTSRSRQNLTLKVNSTYVTLTSGPSQERLCWRRRRNPSLTFYK